MKTVGEKIEFLLLSPRFFCVWVQDTCDYVLFISISSLESWIIRFRNRMKLPIFHQHDPHENGKRIWLNLPQTCLSQRSPPKRIHGGSRGKPASCVFKQVAFPSSPFSAPVSPWVWFCVCLRTRVCTPLPGWGLSFHFLKAAASTKHLETLRI